MNDLKRRKMGFLAVLLAAVLIIGTPGVTAMAAHYYFGYTYIGNDSTYLNYIQLSVGDTVESGDYIHKCYSGGMSMQSGYIQYPGTGSPDCTTNLIGGSGETYTVIAMYPNGDPQIYDPYIVLSYPSSANNSSSSDSPAAGYYRSLAALVSAIKADGGATHGYGIGSALPYSVMKALADNPDDVLVFKTDYKGYHYEFTIQVGEDVKEQIKPEIPWYGPYWLAKYFFKTTVIEKLPEY